MCQTDYREAPHRPWRKRHRRTRWKAHRIGDFGPAVFRSPFGYPLYVEASGSYSTFYLESGKRITVSKNLKRIEQMLQDPVFQRVHNSFLVRLASVQSYNHRNGTLHLQNGKEVPIAVRKREAVRQRLVELMIEVREDTDLPMAAEDAPSMR